LAAVPMLSQQPRTQRVASNIHIVPSTHNPWLFGTTIDTANGHTEVVFEKRMVQLLGVEKVLQAATYRSDLHTPLK
jgi:hypothetical protein